MMPVKFREVFKQWIDAKNKANEEEYSHMEMGHLFEMYLLGVSTAHQILMDEGSEELEEEIQSFFQDIQDRVLTPKH
jgi:hypothetical protein